MKNVYLSVVIPAYNEEKNICILYPRLAGVLKSIGKSYEILFVDDGSTDSTLDKMTSISRKDQSVRVISFKHNFGKASALSIGFKNTKGKYIITMDADLQDNPKEIPNFLKKMEEGYDLVSGWKFKRFDPLTKILPSKFFNFFTRVVTGLKIHDFNCGFKCYKRQVVENIEIYGELHRYVPALVYWKGFSVGEIKVKHNKRLYGVSKYGINRLFKGFFDLATLIFLEKFGKNPLHFFGFLGFISFFMGLIPGLYILYDKFINNAGIFNRPLLLLVVLLIILGMQLISIGLIGEMVVRSGRQEQMNKIIYELIEP